MRSAKEQEYFPYTGSTVCYIEVGKDGEVAQMHHKNKSDRPGVSAAYQRVVRGDSTLYAVWPGKWSSDLFLIDDLEAFAKSIELLETLNR